MSKHYSELLIDERKNAKVEIGNMLTLSQFNIWIPTIITNFNAMLL